MAEPITETFVENAVYIWNRALCYNDVQTVLIRGAERFGHGSPFDSINKIALLIRKCKMDETKVKWVFSVMLDRVQEGYVTVGELSNTLLFGTKEKRGRLDAILALLEMKDYLQGHCPAATSILLTSYTARFCFDGALNVDVTAQLQRGHRPTQVTGALKSALDALPRDARRLSLLVVDTVKHSGACFDGRGRLGKRLKNVHWVLLSVAWWKAQPDDGRHRALYDLRRLLRFYELPFELLKTIDALGPLPFARRDTGAHLAWLCDPAEVRDAAPHVRKVLATCREEMQAEPLAFLQREEMQAEPLATCREEMQAEPLAQPLAHRRWFAGSGGAACRGSGGCPALPCVAGGAARHAAAATLAARFRA